MRYVYNSSRDKHGKKYLKYLRFFLCNFPYSEYKGVIHRGNCTKNKLYNDTEKRKRIRKAIKAPYSQGDVVVFGQNARQECVAMNLCALILHNMKGIGNPDDLKQIMHIGNQL